MFDRERPGANVKNVFRCLTPLGVGGGGVTTLDQAVKNPWSTSTTPPPRDRPLPAAWTVAEGLAAFFAENGYDAAQYELDRTPAKLLGVRFSVPNPPQHRWAIIRHDLHHVATGYGTDLAGEAQLGAWELRRGVGVLGVYVASIVTSAALSGVVVAPRRTLAAWRGSGRHPSLFHLRGREYDDLLRLTIGELRALLAIAPEGLATGPRGLSGLAPRSDGTASGAMSRSRKGV